MKNLIIILACLLSQCSILVAQKFGLVINELSKEPISYVNIHILGTEQGFTSDTEGVFKIDANPKDTLVFTAVGFDSIHIPYLQIGKKVFLTPIIYELPEVSFIDQGEITFKFGELNKEAPIIMVRSWGNSKMLAQLVPFEDKYEETPYLGSIEFLTTSFLKSAKFNVRLYKFDEKGGIGKPLFYENLFVQALKGTNKTLLDLSEYFIEFPKSGLIVVIEWLNIKGNQYTFKSIHKESNKKVKRTYIEPAFLSHWGKNNIGIWHYKGKWIKNEVNFSPIQMEITLKN